MTNGIFALGEFTSDGPCYLYAYTIGYKFRDRLGDIYQADTQFVAGVVMIAYAAGDKVDVFYDAKAPQKSICNPYNVLDYFNLKRT